MDARIARLLAVWPHGESSTALAPQGGQHEGGKTGGKVRVIAEGRVEEGQGGEGQAGRTLLADMAELCCAVECKAVWWKERERERRRGGGLYIVRVGQTRSAQLPGPARPSFGQVASDTVVLPFHQPALAIRELAYLVSRTSHNTTRHACLREAGLTPLAPSSSPDSPAAPRPLHTQLEHRAPAPAAPAPAQPPSCRLHPVPLPRRPRPRPAPRASPTLPPGCSRAPCRDSRRCRGHVGGSSLRTRGAHSPSDSQPLRRAGDEGDERRRSSRVSAHDWRMPSHMVPNSCATMSAMRDVDVLELDRRGRCRSGRGGSPPLTTLRRK